MNMHEKINDILPLRDRLLESEQMMKETGCYDGVTELTLRKQDPLKFETLHTKLRASCVSAREMARRISASPGVREVGEMVVAIYTPEGAAIALSNGIMVHVHTMSRFIKWMIRNVIESAHAAGAKVGLCGQAPSDHPDFAAFLVDCGIDSISVTPDSFIAVKQKVAAAERNR